MSGGSGGVVSTVALHMAGGAELFVEASMAIRRSDRVGFVGKLTAQVLGLYPRDNLRRGFRWLTKSVVLVHFGIKVSVVELGKNICSVP